MILASLHLALAAPGVDAHDLHLAPESPGIAAWAGDGTRRVSARTVLEYAVRPLVRHGANGEEALLAGLFTLDLQASFPIDAGVGVHVALPLHPYATGSGAPGQPVLGDTQLALTLPVFDNDSGALLGARLWTSLPTGAPGANLGSGTPTVGAELAGSRVFGRVQVGCAVSGRSRPRLAVYDLRGGAQIGLQSFVSVNLLDALSLVAEGNLRGQLNPASPPWSESPGEVRLVSKARLGTGHLLLGGSTALTPGVGAPALRAFLGVGGRR